MKDFIITKKRRKREFITLLICFAVSFILNVYAVIAYQSPAKELITSLCYVFIFAIFLYFIWSLIRIVIWIIKRCLTRKSTK
jgi:glucan phosphoethanolaminetransferase (alkaline phosphatase superfamily)